MLRSETAIKQIESLGAEAVEVSLPHTQYAIPVYYLILFAEASSNLAKYDGVRFGLSERNVERPDGCLFEDARRGFWCGDQASHHAGNVCPLRWIL